MILPWSRKHLSNGEWGPTLAQKRWPSSASGCARSAGCAAASYYQARTKTKHDIDMDVDFNIDVHMDILIGACPAAE